MKKSFIYGSIAAIGLAGMASCSNEDEGMMISDGGGVSFTVSVPGNISSRGTFGDGTDAGDRATLDNLQWTVFEVGEDNTTRTKVFSDSKTGAFTSDQSKETVTINLAKGKKYQVAFYADNKANSFVTYTDGVISVDYENAASNTAAEDAFIGKSDIFTVEGAFSKNVTLTRPFAQLNWGTDDKNEKSIETLIPSLTATVTISQGLNKKMDVIAGTVSDPVSEVTTFGDVHFNALPAQTFPVVKDDATAKPYALIAMNYLLTGNGTIDCKLAFNNGLTAVEVNAAPVKVNYRTNIYGSLLTSPGEFNIEVDNNFEDTENIEYDSESFRVATTLSQAQSLLSAGEAKVAIDGAKVTTTGRASAAVLFSLNKTVKSQMLKIYGHAASAVKVAYADLTEGTEASDRAFRLIITGSLPAAELDLPEAKVNLEGRGTGNEKATIANVTITNAASAAVGGAIAVESITKGDDVTADVEFEGAVELTVTDAATFTAAFADPAVEKIIVAGDLDLTAATIEDLTTSSPKALEVKKNATVTLGNGIYFDIHADFTLTGEGTITNAYENDNPADRTSKELFHIRDARFDASDITIINDMDHHWHGPNYNSSAISYWGDCKINITNCHVYSGEYTLCGMGRGGVNTSVVNLKDSYFESNSTNRDNGSHWAYCMRLFGKEGTLEGCEVKGIQGGVSTEEGTFTIKSGKYYTYNTEGNQDAFYPVYATSGTTIIVDGGDFYGPNNRSNLANGTSCLVSGDNDTGRPVGTFVINGGRFSGKAYNHETNSIYAEDSWVETTDAENPLIKWTVK